MKGADGPLAVVGQAGRLDPALSQGRTIDGDADRLELAQVALIDEGLNSRSRRSEACSEVDGVMNTDLLDQAEHIPRLGGIPGHRLLAEDVEPEFCRGDRD